MPLDDAVGGRIDCAASGQRAASLNRLKVLNKRYAGTVKPLRRPRQRAVSASFSIASVAVLDVVMLFVSAVVAAIACADAGVDCTAGEWIIVSLAAMFTAVESQRRLSSPALGRVRDGRTRILPIMLSRFLGGAAGTVCLALLSVPMQGLRLWLPIWLALTILAGATAAMVCARQVQRLCASGRLAQNIAVVGTDRYALNFAHDLRDQSNGLIRYAGLFDEGEGKRETGGGSPDTHHLTDLLAQAQIGRIDAVVLCVPIGDAERISHLRALLRSLNCDIYVAGDFLDLTWAEGTLNWLGQQRVVKIESRPLGEWQVLHKAVFDRLGAAALLVALAPVFMLIALAISVSSEGPVLFRQPRLGLNNVAFTMFKFRTMFHHQADLHGDRQATRNDPRITRVGRFLRRTSLDELPQLFNVLIGDMSLVGPRPHAAATKAAGRLFHDVVADYPLRHRVKPGITGWAQVNGWRGETTTFHQIEQRVAYDLYYIDHWSLTFDVRILFLTLVKEWNSKVAF